MAIKGNIFSTFGNILNVAVETSPQAYVSELERKFEALAIKSLGTFFLMAVNRIDSQDVSFKNDWVGNYDIPDLQRDYEIKKIKLYNAKGPEYFKGAYGLSPSHNSRYKKGKLKGREKYPFNQSLYSKLLNLSKQKTGETLYRASGGIGSRLGVKSGVDTSRGQIIDGKPMKRGVRGGFVKAKWQDIVSEKMVSEAKKYNGNITAGYLRSKNENKMVRPDGRVISIQRAIAEGVFTFNVKGSFFAKIIEKDQGFLHFLINHTKFLNLTNPSGGRNTTSLHSMLRGMASEGRELIDPVFGELLEKLEKDFLKII